MVIILSYIWDSKNQVTGFKHLRKSLNENLKKEGIVKMMLTSFKFKQILNQFMLKQEEFLAVLILFKWKFKLFLVLDRMTSTRLQASINQIITGQMSLSNESLQKCIYSLSHSDDSRHMFSCIIQFIFLHVCSIFPVKFKFLERPLILLFCVLSTYAMLYYKMCGWYLCLGLCPAPSLAQCIVLVLSKFIELNLT